MEKYSAVQFAEENLKTIFAYSLTRVKNKEDAEDLAGEIILKLIQSAQKIDRAEHFYGYIWGIAANTAKAFLRKRAKSACIYRDNAFEKTANVAEDFDAADEVGRLRCQLALLSGEYRKCTVAYYFDHLSCTEISKRFDISLEMVKYYLFKTRKILKEGIGMTEMFGEKSFRPSPFEFCTIFSGKFNMEYSRLFARKLPGQILLSDYYTPMTVRELSLELGVSSVYLEDEIELLEKYELLTKFANGKVQSRLVIFTSDYQKAFMESADPIITEAIDKIARGLKEKLPLVRKTLPDAQGLSDTRLMWALIWPLMRQGNELFEKEHADKKSRTEIYIGATGVNYGISDDETDPIYKCDTFGGYCRFDDDPFYASVADFNAFDRKNRYFENSDTVRKEIKAALNGECELQYLYMTEDQEKELAKVLCEEIGIMHTLYSRLYALSVSLMCVHAPKNIHTQAEAVVCQTLFFRTIGLIGYHAVTGDAMPKIDFDGPAAMNICHAYEGSDEIAKDGRLIELPGFLKKLI